MRTIARCALSRKHRAKWRNEFRTSPSLCNARHYDDHVTMAGFYNDHVRGGFMTERQARKIYTES